MSLSRFPTAFPADEVRILLPLLRGKAPADKWDAFEAGWWLLGYACSQFKGGFATGLSLKTARRRAGGVADDLEKALEYFATPKSREDRRAKREAKLPQLDWKQIAAMLLPLLLDLIGGMA